jgi:hypothetical protein
MKQENKSSEYYSRLKKSLECYFDPEIALMYSKFSCLSISSFDDTPELINKLFDLISLKWGNINWNSVINLSLEGWMIIDFLNSDSYIHVFPSLVLELSQNDNLLTDLFMCNHLTVTDVHKDWEIEFYFSFNDNLRKLIKGVLKRKNTRLSQIALESYWL